MEEKNTQELISVFKIPIKNYEIDMEEDSSREKKNEILDLFANHNQLKSEAEFEEIQFNLHYACKKGDLELIKILLSETIRNSTNDLTFKIDKINQTASLFKADQNLESLIIPRTVKHEMNEYLVTSITGLGCSYSNQSKIKIIKFEEDSSVSTIYLFAFSYSNIEEIYFPKSLIELKEGWCYETKYLNKIIISPLNEQFIFKDDKYLLGKSDINNDEFDILLFVRRDIEEFSIPSNIKIIGSCSFSYLKIRQISIPPNVTKICEYAFSDCSNLRKVEIPTNSNLQTIERYAFSYSKIEKISIPPSLTKICEYAFSDCSNLRKVEIPTNSNLQIIERNVFSDSKIEEIYFPKSLIELKEEWCYLTKKLTKITISPLNEKFIFKDDKYLLGKSDINNDEFDILLFVRRDIEEISIPSSLTKICEYAFSNCSKLRKVEIPTNSNLQIIERNAFSNSKIEEIFIPSSLTKICENTFSDCSKLRKVEIPTNSNLQIIERYAFSNSKIKKIYIPSNVTKICERAFSVCPNLRKVEIPTNSNLQIIERDAFSYSNIEEFFIPSSLTEICVLAFSFCKEFRIIEFSEESKLQSFPKLAFLSCPKLIIMIPQTLKRLIQTINNA